MQEVDAQLCIIKRLSMDRLTAAIMRTHEDNGCCSPLSWDSFRKLLAVAVRELGYILQRCDNMVELGAANYPSGLLAECGGCWFAGQAGEVDCHLKIHEGAPQLVDKPINAYTAMQPPSPPDKAAVLCLCLCLSVSASMLNLVQII